jgi:hypothetical protein
MVLSDDSENHNVVIIDFGVSILIKSEEDKILNKRVGTVKLIIFLNF